MLSESILLFADTEPGGLAVIWSQMLLWTRVALGIGLVIFVHELGHFAAAKSFGVKCEKFYVGFDPPMKIGPIKLPSSLGKFRYGETEYGIGIIPLGGYVKMLGQDDDPRKMKAENQRARVGTDDEEPESNQTENSVEEEDEIQLDPRSLPAKPVWQRMIIMSAGVFMNVVTGVMFAAAAFFFGVPYQPAVIGGVSPGGPAWQAGIQTGGQVVSVDGLDDAQMHFREMSSTILHAGLDTPDRPIPVTLRFNHEGQQYEHSYDLITQPHPINRRFRMIGINPPRSHVLGKKNYALPKSAASSVLTDSDAGAKIVSYDGIAIDEDAIVPINPFLNYVYSQPNKTIELELKRTDGKVHRVALPPQVSKWIGVRTQVGPVNALVENGPAAQAGMKVGDVIESINDIEDLDSELLLLTLTKKATAKFLVRRGNESLTIEITPNEYLQTVSPTSGHGDRAAFNPYGFAFELPTTVATFHQGALAEGESLHPGDLLQKVILLPTNKYPDEFSSGSLAELVKELEEGWEFDQDHSMADFLNSIQPLPEGSQFKLVAKRAETGVIAESIVKLAVDSPRVRFERGLGFAPMERIQTATSLKEASVLGLREGKRRLGDIFRFLRMAFGGKVSKNDVGGPIRIFQVAGAEAERGVSTQLLFLTLLSMNLAVLNFLPIPILDGGHMVFLICEAIMGRRVNEELEMRLTLIGGLMLLALMVFVFFNDLINI